MKTGVKKENDINKFLAESSIVLEDVEIKYLKYIADSSS